MPGAWDMMSQTTFSAPIGFLEAGGDVEGILASVEKDVNYFAVVRERWVLDNDNKLKSGRSARCPCSTSFSTKTH